MKFNTPYDRIRDPGEINNEDSVVEVLGYMDAKTQISRLITAGKKLVDYRKDQYDFNGEEINENFYDPTRDSNFDIADASELSAGVNMRLNKLKKQKEKDKKVVNKNMENKDEKEIEK